MRTCVLCFSLLLLASAARAAEPPKSPLSPEESLKHFVLGDPNLVIEIAAAEPEVIDPVSMQFDEHGRMWVVEMRDYPTGPQNAPPPLGGPDAKPLSRIKLLEDKDGDGRFETAHVFADNLLFATGVQPWDGGVIVTLAGEVAYFKDTDGDHKADVRETWFTGFAQANTQLRANHPTFGPDGWIYVANGLRGGNVIAVKKDWPSRLGLRPDPSERKQVGTESQPTGISHDPANPVPVSLTGRDFKFDPLTGRYEAISGNGQFGLTFDAWGNRFVCDNRHPCRHVIFEEDFIRRCPHVAFPAVVNDVIPPDDKNKVFPLTSAWTTSNLHAGTFTASCGVTVYTGDWLPEDYRGNVFVCEPTGNLVQRAILEPDGVTFKSHNPHERSRHAPRDEPNASSTPTNKSTPGSQSTSTARSADLSRSNRATQTQEFLASRDDWFRPVDLQNGPDGALYVVDMYRAVIEHPEWVPDELKNRPDTWLGNDMGRIYRIRSVSKDRRPLELDDLRAKPFVFLNDDGVDADNDGSEDQNLAGWYRPMASRLLHEKLIHQDGMTVLTEQFVESGSRYRDGQRVLWHPELSSSMWQSPHLSKLVGPSAGYNSEAAREAYLRLERLILKRLTAQACNDGSERVDRDRAAVFAMEILFRGLKDHDADQSFQLQALQTWHELGTSPGTRTALAARIAQYDLRDPWLRQALIAAAGDRPAQLLAALVRDGALQIGSGGMRGGAFDFEPSHWEPSAELFSAIGELIGKNAERDDVARSISLLCQPPVPGPMSFQIAASGLLGIAKGITRRGDKWKGSLSEVSIDAAAALADVAPKAIQQIAFIDKDRPHWSHPRRRIAVRLLAQLNDDKSSERLQQLVASETDQALRLTALEAFASSGHSEVDTWLLDRYSVETPVARRVILSALLASKERQLALLGAIADGQIAATEIDPVRTKQLTESKDEAVREKARQVLAAAAPASRKEVLEAYQPALTLKADPQRGREVFQKNCVTCHRIGDLGVNVAPDISDTRTKKPEQLLLDILDPNRAIDANYFAYAVVTKDGKTESGVIASETSNSITLKQPEGKVLTLLRTDIDELRNTGLSLMPVGVEKNINPQQMADLIFWLKNWRYLKDNVPATSLK